MAAAAASTGICDPSSSSVDIEDWKFPGHTENVLQFFGDCLSCILVRAFRRAFDKEYRGVGPNEYSKRGSNLSCISLTYSCHS
jgi:hypothetical protein